MAKTTDPEALYSLAEGLAAVADRLEPEEADQLCSQAATLLSHGMAKVTTPVNGAVIWMTWTFRTALRAPGGPEAFPRAAALVGSVGTFPVTGHPVASLGLVAPNLPRPCRLSTQELVELLKQPTCVGHARRVVLEQLEFRYQRRFTDHWEFVRFAKEQSFGLDFTGLPQRFDQSVPAPAK
jgi:hypothetical protein